MSYRDDFGASLAQNKVLADELKKAQKRIEKTGPREIPNLDDVMLELLMGWENGITWLKNGWVVLKTQNKNGAQYGITFDSKWRKVDVFIAVDTGTGWGRFRNIHVVKGNKAKILKQALSYSYIKFGTGVKWRKK
jgi:hypothetical protein